MRQEQEEKEQVVVKRENVPFLFWLSDQVGADYGDFFTWFDDIINNKRQHKNGTVGDIGYNDMAFQVFQQDNGVMNAIIPDDDFLCSIFYEDGNYKNGLNINILNFQKERIEKQGQYKEPGSLLGRNKWSKKPDEWDEDQIDEYLYSIFGNPMPINEAIKRISKEQIYIDLANNFIQNPTKYGDDKFDNIKFI